MESARHGAKSMSPITYAVLAAVWVGGFALGYLLRSYVSYRRRMRARRSRYWVPETQRRIMSVPDIDGNVTTLVPQARPTHPEQRADHERRSSSRDGCLAPGECQPKTTVVN